MAEGNRSSSSPTTKTFRNSRPLAACTVIIVTLFACSSLSLSWSVNSETSDRKSASETCSVPSSRRISQNSAIPFNNSCKFSCLLIPSTERSWNKVLTMPLSFTTAAAISSAESLTFRSIKPEISSRKSLSFFAVPLLTGRAYPIGSFNTVHKLTLWSVAATTNLLRVVSPIPRAG